MKTVALKTMATLCALILLTLPFAACDRTPSVVTKSVDPGAAWEVTGTTRLDELNIGEGAVVNAPEGKSVTLTVDGVETGIAPGVYTGDVVLTVTEECPIKFQETTIHPFRQALYLDKTGIVDAKSVLAAAGPYTVSGETLTGARIVSRGERFNSIYANGGTHIIKEATIDLTGNGGNDFAGYGAAVMSDGPGTTLVVDSSKINTQGAIRTAFVAQHTSNLVVKNSTIATKNGKLPETYVTNVTPGQMMDVPWMLGITGNCRATNLLGDNTTATYINSDISAEGWGVLSVDDSKNAKVTAVNSRITITGASGYGTYAIGNSTNAFYGCDITVPDYAAINRGGLVIYGDSTPETLAILNTDLKLGLTADELGALKPTRTTINSKRFGVMWHGQGNVRIQDDTVINTEKAVFLDKGQTADIKVDGSKGAQLTSRSGVILQIIEDDDPGPVMENGIMVNKGVYDEPTEAPIKAEDFDVTMINETDITATFANISLKGDFYNAIRGGSRAGADNGLQAGGMGGPAGGMPGPPPGGEGGPGGGMPGPAPTLGKNMVLTFNNAYITGVITASSSRHAKSSIGAKDYKLLGEVTNTPGPAINNGVIVSLDSKSAWTVTGTSYLTSLIIAEGAALVGPEGRKVTMSVDGVETAIAAGACKGDIVLTAD